MTSTNLVCYEFKLQDIKGLEDLISKAEYGLHVLSFMEKNFGVKFRSLTAHKSAGIWNEVLISSDDNILTTLRVYDRTKAGKNYNYLLTMNMDIVG